MYRPIKGSRRRMFILTEIYWSLYFSRKKTKLIFKTELRTYEYLVCLNRFLFCLLSLSSQSCQVVVRFHDALSSWNFCNLYRSWRNLSALSFYNWCPVSILHAASNTIVYMAFPVHQCCALIIYFLCDVFLFVSVRHQFRDVARISCYSWAGQ